jgi:hypothetical protein
LAACGCGSGRSDAYNYLKGIVNRSSLDYMKVAAR